jgi:hypothetical protein
MPEPLGLNTKNESNSLQNRCQRGRAAMQLPAEQSQSGSTPDVGLLFLAGFDLFYIIEHVHEGNARFWPELRIDRWLAANMPLSIIVAHGDLASLRILFLDELLLSGIDIHDDLFILDANDHRGFMGQKIPAFRIAHDLSNDNPIN